MHASLERVEGQPALVGNHQFAVQDQFLPQRSRSRGDVRERFAEVRPGRDWTKMWPLRAKMMTRNPSREFFAAASTPV
ncbi:hypothetical protein AA958_28935 [Streptomyces sp. CNQ-509]|nr:hypothetical protein AA958_28935 [Streptomyces sp. CNQ-509]